MAKSKGLSLSIPQDSIMYTNISKSQDGYNSARLVAKMGEKEYMSVSYEWEGTGVPGFAMDLMNAMQAAAAKSGEAVAGFEEEYEEHSKKKGLPPWMKKDDEDDSDKKDKDGKKKGKDKDDKKKKKDKDDKKKKKEKSKEGTKPVPGDTTKKHSPKVCENCGNAEEDCTCGGKKQLKKTKEKKGADKKTK